MRSRLSGWRRTITGVILSLPLLALVWMIGDTFIEDDNFRVVSANLYRAGQLRSDEWNESYQEHPYRSVLNLRGSHPGQSWYEVERRFADEHDLRHYDFALSANAEPSVDDMRRLIDIMRGAPKPLLIHCKDGADRSGLVAALFLYAVDGASSDDATGQLSLWFGHFPWLMSRTGAMDRSLARFIASRQSP